MDVDSVFLDRPAYTDRNGTARRGFPAAVEDCDTLGSTHGAEQVRIRCPAGHWSVARSTR